VDATQIRLVQDSFRQVVPIQETAGQLFYQRLFELDPSLRPLFKADLTNQIRALMAMLSTAVFGLNRLEEITPAVQALGRRHVNYGVQDTHYATVGQALLDTLEKGLGSAFTPETRAAWTEAYGILASVMQEAAGEPVPA
jgi:hemoglobin-like flavoprotein